MRTSIVIGWFFCFQIWQDSFHWIISDGVISGVRRKWKRSDFSNSDSVELMTPASTSLLVKTSLKRWLWLFQFVLQNSFAGICIEICFNLQENKKCSRSFNMLKGTTDDTWLYQHCIWFTYLFKGQLIALFAVLFIVLRRAVLLQPYKKFLWFWSDAHWKIVHNYYYYYYLG